MDTVIVESISNDTITVVEISDAGLPGPAGPAGASGIFTGSETVVDLGTKQGVVTIDMSLGSVFLVTTGTSDITFTVINPPAANSGKLGYATIWVTQGATPRQLAAVTNGWAPYGVKQLLTPEAAALDKLYLETRDGGASVHYVITSNKWVPVT